MNYWTDLSVQFANQRNYLDELFKVYPMSPNLKREIPEEKLNSIEKHFIEQNNIELIQELLDLEIFPLKDSYVAFLKRDRTSILRNPNTVNRLAGNLYQDGYDVMIEKCIQPKETNRQIGPLFKRWIASGVLGLKIFNNESEFLNYNGDALFNSSDDKMMKFCLENLGYNHDKGIDFIARINEKYVIGEAKFLSDFGGHQNAQFNDALAVIDSNLANPKLNNEIIKIAILDGVLYIRGRNKMYRYLEENSNQIILTSLVLREFLFSL